MTADSTSTLDDRLLRLHPNDNVAVARCDLAVGESVTIGGEPVSISTPVPTGHKLAIRPIAAHQKVLKYGAPIGSAIHDIKPGDYVHPHNLASDYLPTYARDGSNPYLQDD